VQARLHIDSTSFISLRIELLSEVKSMLLITLAKLISSLKKGGSLDIILKFTPVL